MDGQGADARSTGTEPTLQLEDEQQVGELAVAVCLARAIGPHVPVEVVEIEPSACVSVGRDGDDPVGDVGQQQVRQREVAEVVRADLALEAVGSSRASGTSMIPALLIRISMSPVHAATKGRDTLTRGRRRTPRDPAGLRKQDPCGGNGVAYGARTRNLRSHNPMLCRLS
jgi:hypothetical protein